MSEWDLITLGDLALERGGSVDPAKHPDEVFELYSIPAFDAGKPEILQGSKIGSSKKAVEPDDIMISRIVPHIRRACVVGRKNGHRQIASGEWIIFRSRKIWPQYLRWVLVGDTFHSEFMRTVSGVGGSLLRARPTEVFKIKIPLPPLAQQKRIAGILDAADALRAKRRQALAQLDTLLQATFLDLFGDPVTNPKGWKTRRFADVANDSFRNGLSPSTTGKVEGEVLTLSAITGGRFKFEERKAAFFDRKPATTQLLSSNTFLICRGNGNKRLVGTAVFPDRSSDNICFPDTMIGVAIDADTLAAPYLQRVWASEHVRRQIESNARTTNGTYKVNQQVLGAVEFPVPPIDEQKQFARSAAVIEKQRAVCNQHLAELDTLFASLQSRAFRGEL